MIRKGPKDSRRPFKREGGSNDRPARDGAKSDRPARKPFNREPREDRDSRPSKFNRDDRPARPSREPREDRGGASNDRPARKPFGRDDNSSRKPFNREPREDRDSRPSKFNRDDRPARPSREPREDRSGASNDRPARKPFGRDDNSSRKPFNREPREDRDSRPSKFNRDDRPARPSRAPREGRDEHRPERRPYGGEPRESRDSRPPREENRPTRKPFNREPREDRDSRPSRFNRDDRPARPTRDDRDDRTPRTENREERPFRESRGLPFTRSTDKPKRFRVEEGDVPPVRRTRSAKPFDKDAPKVFDPNSDLIDQETPDFLDFNGPSRGRQGFNRDVDRPYTRGGERPYKREEGGIKKLTRKESPIIDKDLRMRLNRYIANAGVCSRREADELIAAGAVSVNGKVITEMGYRLEVGDKVNYGGETLKKEKHVYVLLNKPKDFITTSDDPGNRKTVFDLVKKACKERIYPVGRLDRNTTGLLLLTNDGELTKKLTHPKHGVRKVYHVTLDKPVTKSDLDKLANEGAELTDGPVMPDVVSYVGDNKKEVGIELHSGRNRVVRRIFESMGYEVIKLDRVVFAGLTKKDLPRGDYRMLTEKEVSFLKMLG